MDDLLIFILTVAVAIIGAVGQRKKKRQAKTSGMVGGEDAGSRGGSIWDMIMPEEEVHAHGHGTGHDHHIQEPLTAGADLLPEEKKQGGYEFTARSEGQSDIIDDQTKRPRQKMKKKLVVEGEKFSLRKAVIYKEILNRKYS